jgi:glycosyltransferase involved in cell wall biosynthesis
VLSDLHLHMVVSNARPHSCLGPEHEADTVAVVVTTFNDAAFLGEALSSVMAQQHPADEVIVVDDGSDESPAPALACFPQVTLLRKRNAGLSSARNTGLHAARSRYILFLDADDRLQPNAIATSLACVSRNPETAMVYGGHRRIRSDGNSIGSDRFETVGEDAYASLLTGNRIGMHAAVLYRRDALLALGGFDESLRKCEDYDIYLRLAQRYPIEAHPDIIAEYRWHGANMSADPEQMLRAVLAVHDRHRGGTPGHRRAWRAGRRNWKEYYRAAASSEYSGNRTMTGRRAVRHRIRSVVRRLEQKIRDGRLHRLLNNFRSTWPPPKNAINFGHLGSARPISLDFGWDRGTPIDRYYIERFLASRAEDITGNVLEIGDNTYSKRYGGAKIMRQDVLHVAVDHPDATITGDLTQEGVLPENTFDCIIFTQTLQLIFELEQAVCRLHRALRRGGVLLLTTPGISQLDRGEWGDRWCWSFTAVAVRRLFERHFPPDALDVSTHGNVFAATTFLHGVALEEVDQKKLDVNDQAYPVVITLRAQKR